MAPQKVSLTYFNARGRAESIRWALSQAGVKFEDNRVEQPDWPALKPKTPTGGLPFLVVDGKEIGQSGAVAHYVAAEYGMNGSNSMQAALVHMIWDSSQDLLNQAFKPLFMPDGDEKTKIMKEIAETHLPAFLKVIKPRLVGGRKWLVGEKVTIADIAAGHVLSETSKDPAFLKAISAEPEIAALVKRVRELPNIKNWIANRPDSPF